MAGERANWEKFKGYGSIRLNDVVNYHLRLWNVIGWLKDFSMSYTRAEDCKEGNRDKSRLNFHDFFLSRRAPGATWVLVLAASEECFPIFAIETGYSLTRILSQTTVTGCLGEQARSNLHTRLCQERLPSFLLFPPRFRYIPFFSSSRLKLCLRPVCASFYAFARIHSI